MQTSAKVAPDGHASRRALPPAVLDGGWEAGAYGMRVEEVDPRTLGAV